MAVSSIRIFGIRHHGPGSAHSLVRGLEAFQPDAILVEAPPDVDALFPLAAHPEMRPPVALLVYNPKDLQQASFFPFAEFSPEWQAALFAEKNRIPLRCMDLPLTHAFALKAADEREPELMVSSPEDKAFSNDPFRELAALAGYSDPERWWESLLERIRVDDGEAPVFQGILEMMTALREAKRHPESRETLLREAYMRQTLRIAKKEGFEKIAVVCGAWHGPALADPGQFSALTDASLLKGLKKVKTEATWIPWSFDRLSTQSGYRAGIIAPAWYRLLFRHYQGLSVGVTGSHADTAITSEFLSHAARLLRANDIAASSANVVEAVRLANALATLRRTAHPGIEELREAAVTVLCAGAEKPLELIDRALVIGDVLGAVPSTVPVAPIRADFEAQAKSARLKISTEPKPLALDLREDADQRKSRLLHRLQLLGVAWGKPEAVGEGKQGRFHENWMLHWQPDFEIRLIEAGTWGNTVEEAALQLTRRRVHFASALADLVQLLGITLKADLSALLPDLLARLQQTAALIQDALLLADAVLPLAEILRYGSARPVDTEAVDQLLSSLVPRACLQLPAACTGVDEEVAADILKKLLAVNRALGILRAPEYDGLWQRALEEIAQQYRAAPLLAGAALRLLFDKNLLAIPEVGDGMRYRLSHGQAPGESAQWLEGFLFGSGLLLIHHPALWALLDDWLRELEEGSFREVLPLLRRAFSQFAEPEREKMLALAKRGARSEVFSEKETEGSGWEMERVEAVLPLLREILA